MVGSMVRIKNTWNVLHCVIQLFKLYAKNIVYVQNVHCNSEHLRI